MLRVKKLWKVLKNCLVINAEIAKNVGISECLRMNLVSENKYRFSNDRTFSGKQQVFAPSIPLNYRLFQRFTAEGANVFRIDSTPPYRDSCATVLCLLSAPAPH